MSAEAVVDARKALVKAIWSCIVDASSMNVVMSGPETNAAMDTYRLAIEAEARATERARIAGSVMEVPAVEVDRAEWNPDWISRAAVLAIVEEP